jgi:excisionase family DNA binding protein
MVVFLYQVWGEAMTIEIDGETYYTTEEACSYLGVSRDTLNRMAKDGRLHKYRQGFARTVYYRQTELEALRAMRPIEGDEDQAT